LPQTNESATVAKSKIFLKLNKALLYFHILSCWPVLYNLKSGTLCFASGKPAKKWSFWGRSYWFLVLGVFSDSVLASGFQIQIQKSIYIVFYIDFSSHVITAGKSHLFPHTFEFGCCKNEKTYINLLACSVAISRPKKNASYLITTQISSEFNWPLYIWAKSILSWSFCPRFTGVLVYLVSPLGFVIIL